MEILLCTIKKMSKRKNDEKSSCLLFAFGKHPSCCKYDLAIVRAWEKLWMLPDEISEKIEAARVAEVGAEA